MATILPSYPATATTASAVSVPRSAYVGPRWRLVAVGHQGHVYAVPVSVGAWVRFTASGQFQMRDGVNGSSATFTSTPGGFRRSEMASTLAGYNGTDPVRLAVMKGMGAVMGLGTESHIAGEVSIQMSSGRLVLDVDGYDLRFE